MLICLCGAGYFRFQLLLFVLRIRQPLRVIVLPRIALLQLVAGLLKRAFILTDRILLKLKGALKGRKLRRQTRRGRLEIFHARRGQPERRLRFLDLFIDGFDIACEIIAVQRQRYHEIAECLAHASSPPFVVFKHNLALDKSEKDVYTMYKQERGGASMQVQLKPWGNSQGIRFSKEFLKNAGFQPNDMLTAEISDGKIILSRGFRHRSLKERAAEYGGKLNLSEEIDWGEPMGDEVW